MNFFIGKNLVGETSAHHVSVKNKFTYFVINVTKSMCKHQFTVKPVGSAYSIVSNVCSCGLSGTHEFNTRGTCIKIQEGNLLVNDEAYGIVPKNADILVDHGKVFISGQERFPL